MSADSYNLFIKELNKSNTLIVQDLLAKGDSLLYPHMLDHFASFDSRTNCKSFMKVAYTRGFLGSSSFNYQRNCWEVHFYKAETINENNIDELINKVNHFVLDFNGQYDGWFTTKN